MGIVFRQSFTNTIILFVGIGVGFVNEFLLLRNFLQEEEIGLIKLLIQSSMLVAQFATLGGVNSMLRFFPFFRNEKEEHGGILFGLLSIGGIGFLFSCAMLWMFWEPISARYEVNSPLFIEYAYLLPPLIFFSLNFLLLEAYAKSNYRTISTTVLRDLILRLLITATISIYAFKLISIREFYWLFTIVNCLISVFLGLWLGFKGELRWRPRKDFFQGPRFRQIVQYGLITIISGFTARIYTTIDSLMIGDLIGLSALAVYATGTYLTSVLMTPGRAMLRIASPLVADYWKNEDLAGMGKLYRQVSINNLIVCGLLFLLIWASATALLSLTREPEVWMAAIPVFLILGGARLYDVSTGLNGFIIISSKQYWFIPVLNAITAVLAISLNALLIPRYGIVGAAWATFLVIIIFNTARIAFVWFRFGLFPFSPKTLAVVATGAISWYAAAWLPDFGDSNLSLWLEAGIRCLLITIVFTVIVFAANLSDDLTERLADLTKFFRRKK